MKSLTQEDAELLYQWLIARLRAADHDGRTISAWIERLIEQALERHPTAQENPKLRDHVAERDKPKRTR